MTNNIIKEDLNNSNYNSPKKQGKYLEQLNQLSTTNTLGTANKLTSENNLNPIKSFNELQNPQISENNETPSLLYKFIFFLFGLSSLISWNAILSSFAFFEEKFGQRVYNTYTVPLNFGNLLIGLSMPYIAPKISLSVRLTYAMWVLSITLIILPSIGFLLPSEGNGNNTQLGYILTVILVFMQGSINAIAQNSTVALAAQKGGKLGGIFWIGNGFSGLIMAILTCLCTVIFPPKNEGDGVNPLSVIIFFGFAVILSITTAILSKIYISKEKIQEQKEQVKQFNKKDIIQAIKVLRFLPIFICLIYICTFTVFPGLMLANIEFDSNFLSKDSGLWGLQLLNLTYQIGDVLGRYIANNQIFHKLIPQYILTICRYVFVFTGAIVAYDKGGNILNNDWFPFINMLLLSATNGFNTACLMAIGPKLAKGNKNLQEIIGFICSFMLILGIILGAFIAYPINPEN